MEQKEKVPETIPYPTNGVQLTKMELYTMNALNGLLASGMKQELETRQHKTNEERNDDLVQIAIEIAERQCEKMEQYNEEQLYKTIFTLGSLISLLFNGKKPKSFHRKKETE